MSKAGELVECWDVKQQIVSVLPATQVHSASIPLLSEYPKKQQASIIFPLCPDHLIILLQFNALRAMAANRSLISGVLVTPLDCDKGGIHVIPYSTKHEQLPSTLLPTIIQQTMPHSDWIDMFPSPEGRDRLIRAAGTFDEDDLWADCVGGLYEGFPHDEVERRGIIAWSPTWDIKGWEMSPGFLRKWGWLVDGLPGVLEATNRWRVERGEEPLVRNDAMSYAAV